jgi:hypothetical protein
MTLGTRLAPHYRQPKRWFTEEELQDHIQNPPSPSKAPFAWAPLRPAAFRPKQYTITLSRGRFSSPWYLSIKRPYPIFQNVYNRSSPPRYLSQLTFDISPYPPREEFAEGWSHGVNPRNLDLQRYWEMKVFVRDSTEKTWAETLDPWWWLSPTMGDYHTRRGE